MDSRGKTCERSEGMAANLVKLHPGVMSAVIVGSIGGVASMVLDAASHGGDAFLDEGRIFPRTALLSGAIAGAGYWSENPAVTAAGLAATLTPIGLTLLTSIIKPAPQQKK